MSKSLAKFLDRRKKTTVKAAALLQKTEEAVQEKAKAEAEVEEVPSEHHSDSDDEMRVSDDEYTNMYKNQAQTSSTLLLSVMAVSGDSPEERTPKQDIKPTQLVWQNIADLVQQEEMDKGEQPKEDTSKVWVPRFKNGSKNNLSTKDDIDLAEAARILAAKSEQVSSKKTKTVKKKVAPSKPVESEDHACYVKIKFDVFSLLPEEYHTFKSSHTSTTLATEKVKAKYIVRPAFTEAT